MSKEKILAYCLLGLLLLAIVIFLTVTLWPETPDVSSGMGLTVDPYSGTYAAVEQEETEGSSGGIAIPGWGSIRIKAGETLVDVNLENPIDNQNGYNMSFALYLKGETEALAETGLIRPGESALKLKLSHSLEPGEYEATVHVQPYRMSDGSATNNAEIETILIAE